MNRENIIIGIELLRFAAKINQQMIECGEILTSTPFSEEDTNKLQCEIISAVECIEILENYMKNDIAKEMIKNYIGQLSQEGDHSDHDFHD